MRKKILMIATSNATELNGKKTGLWLSELTHFLDVIDKAGFDFDLASPLGGDIPLDESSSTASQMKDPINARFMADPTFVAKLHGSLKCSEVAPSHRSEPAVRQGRRRGAPRTAPARSLNPLIVNGGA